MSTREQRIEVFQDTLGWIDTDPDLSTAVDYGKKHTEIFYENDYPAFNSSNSYNTEIPVSMDRSYQASIRLKKSASNSKIAVMNFANAFHAGGGVKNGSSAQEECLCRTSTLYPLLYRRSLRDKKNKRTGTNQILKN